MMDHFSCTALQCSAAEWAARQQLASCYRVFQWLGWTELIYNHISLRVPGEPEHLLLNRFGLHYSEVKASNLVKINHQGQSISPAGAPVNAAGVAPHSAIHAGVAGAHCVMHTHTTAGMAVASSRVGLTYDNFYAAQLFGRVATHDFEGITVHAEEGARLVANIHSGGRANAGTGTGTGTGIGIGTGTGTGTGAAAGAGAGNGGSGAPKPAVILRNHGLLAWGSALPVTFYTLWIMQRACEIQLAGAALGATIPIDDRTRLACQADAKKVNSEPEFGSDTFNAMVRLVDRTDPSWRE
jgi:ribulose-5-phosphate 4-epimerase/fuculose-1-phosphate aldolase